VKTKRLTYSEPEMGEGMEKRTVLRGRTETSLGKIDVVRYEREFKSSGRDDSFRIDL